MWNINFGLLLFLFSGWVFVALANYYTNVKVLNVISIFKTLYLSGYNLLNREPIFILSLKTTSSPKNGTIWSSRNTGRLRCAWTGRRKIHPTSAPCPWRRTRGPFTAFGPRRCAHLARSSVTRPGCSTRRKWGLLRNPWSNTGLILKQVRIKAQCNIPWQQGYGQTKSYKLLASTYLISHKYSNCHLMI